MKKLFFLAAFATAIIFTSCKKEYTCSCIIMDDTGTKTTKEKTFESSKKEDATSDCENNKIIQESPMEHNTCKLK